MSDDKIIKLEQKSGVKKNSFICDDKGKLTLIQKTPNSRKESLFDLSRIDDEPVIYNKESSLAQCIAIASLFFAIRILFIAYPFETAALYKVYAEFIFFIFLSLGATGYYFYTRVNDIAYTYKNTNQLAFAIRNKPADETEAFIRSLRDKIFIATLLKTESDITLLDPAIDKLFQNNLITQNEKMLYKQRVSEAFIEV